MLGFVRGSKVYSGFKFYQVQKCKVLKVFSLQNRCKPQHFSTGIEVTKRHILSLFKWRHSAVSHIPALPKILSFFAVFQPSHKPSLDSV